ncbi:MAG: HNH endonuclease, partial [Candidatus Microthrix parvicella]
EIDHLHEHGRGGATTQTNAAPLCGLCRIRHKPHYAESVIMPNSGADVLVSAEFGLSCSA